MFKRLGEISITTGTLDFETYDITFFNSVKPTKTRRRNEIVKAIQKYIHPGMKQKDVGDKVGIKEPVTMKQITTGSFSGSCAAKHPLLDLGKGLSIQGGSATRREPEGNYDVFVSLDNSMKKTKASYPWNDGVEFVFPIQDMSVPKDKPEFDKLIEYLEDQMLVGHSVFVGCIGGHGRTGLVLAVLVKRLLGIDDAITHVRNNYCKKAVESQEQVDWLHTHYGITKVDASKGFSKITYSKDKNWSSKKSAYSTGFSGGLDSEIITPIDEAGRIFGNYVLS